MVINLIIILIFCFKISAYADVSTSSNDGQSDEITEKEGWKYLDVEQLYEEWTDYNRYKQQIILEYIKIINKKAYSTLVNNKV